METEISGHCLIVGPLNPIAKAALLLKHLGPAWVVFRARYALRRKFGGLVRRSPIAPWESLAVPDGEQPRLFDTGVAVGPRCVEEAEEILRGTFRLFSSRKVDAGFPPDWHRNWLNSNQVNPFNAVQKGLVHWSEIDAFASEDVKGIWELSRFPWAFALARAFARTRDDRYAEAFWSLFENWLDRNPPNAGPNWMCGQEATFRLIAATFAAEVCDGSPATTPARRAEFRQFVVATGRRIDANLDYALSQSNNHGISETVGLITAAVLVPAEPAAARWRGRGLAALQAQLRELVYADGAFSQHSANYHRVLLHDLVWCARVLVVADGVVPVWLREAGARATRFLLTFVDPSTGHVPLYGANDGANVLPIADGDYLDFRPVAQAAALVFLNEIALPPGPWDEAAAWLAPAEVVAASGTSAASADRLSNSLASSPRPMAHGQAPIKPSSTHFPEGGLLVARRRESQLVLRCPTRFRHRPSHADLLHVGLTFRSQAIAIDAGSYSYNASGPFAGALKEAAVHNTVTFNGREPMTKLSRFLYLPWPRGCAGWSADQREFEAAHDGWERLCIRHVRRVRESEHGWCIDDRLAAAGRRRARLHWLLGDAPHELDVARRTLKLDFPAGRVGLAWEAPADASITLVRADPNSSRGWWSPHYGEIVPALSFAIEFDFTGESRCATRFEFESG